jgi:hypothetical protein
MDAARNMKIARGYVTAPEDKEALAKDAKLPVKDIRCATVKGEAFPKPKWRMRKGELLAVCSLTVLGDDRWTIAEAVEWIRGQGADVIEVPAGRVAGAGVAMLNDALSRIHGKQRRMTPEDAKARARARHEAKRKGRMPVEEATVIWRSARYKRWQDAIAKMRGWTKEAAYKEIGPRTVGTGRPKKS